MEDGSSRAVALRGRRHLARPRLDVRARVWMERSEVCGRVASVHLGVCGVLCLGSAVEERYECHVAGVDLEDARDQGARLSLVGRGSKRCGGQES